MDQPDRAVEPHFTRPSFQFVVMLVVLGLVGAGVSLIAPQIESVFFANLYLNLFIAAVFLFGVGATLLQVLQVHSSVRWLELSLRHENGHDPNNPPRLLAPLAGLLRGRGDAMQISSTSARSILDSVATRIDEVRDITRYVTNLLIFLGLLGTFYGLATTVPAVVETIKSLAPAEGDGELDVFNRLMTGLESQLSGMGTAFSSSLLGLAGSLVVGLLELFASHGQNRFYRQLEEWLSSITRLGFAPGEDGAGAVDAGDAVAAWAAHIARQVETMGDMQTQSDASRAQLDERLGHLVESMERLARQTEADGALAPYLIRIAEGQQQMLTALQDLGSAGGNSAYVDAESRMRLRSIDVQLLRLLEEMSAGRQESLSELRGDMATLTRAIRQLAGGRT
ncbi:MAG: biopolymer transporter ExbB [Rhodobacterales bacterium]|nr:MAG: biopolymer transporter ExbB [Rhodobacterales bacterium]